MCERESQKINFYNSLLCKLNQESALPLFYIIISNNKYSAAGIHLSNLMVIYELE